MSAQSIIAHVPLALFLIIGAIAIASSILVVAMRKPFYSALFLLVTFLCVAVLFVIQGAEFVGAVQILVYAGGVMVLFLFVVMLINMRDLVSEVVVSPFWKGGVAVGLIIFGLFVGMIRSGAFPPNAAPIPARGVVVAARAVAAERMAASKTTGNSEVVGMELYRAYLVPFEVASLFLLVAMIGAIVIGKRELESSEEEIVPDFIHDRVAEEHRIKEVTGA
jgi:NADH-quinone oxidoreductase subunit J